jgi:protein subunit release factor B
VPIRKEKHDDLQLRMEGLGIKEDDLIEKFILGSGKGGQNLQKTSSCVYIKHIPTGIEVKCQKSRSRDINRYQARKLICEKIQAQVYKIKTEKQSEHEKIRRQKQRRTRKQKEKMLEDKHRHSGKKELRSTPKPHD